MANAYNYAGAGFSGVPGGYLPTPGVQNFITPTFPNVNAGMPGVNFPQVSPNSYVNATIYGPPTEVPAPQPGQSILVSPLNSNNLGGNVQWGEQRVLYQPTVQLPPGVILPDVTPGFN